MEREKDIKGDPYGFAFIIYGSNFVSMSFIDGARMRSAEHDQGPGFSGKCPRRFHVLAGGTACVLRREWLPIPRGTAITVV